MGDRVQQARLRAGANLGPFRVIRVVRREPGGALIEAVDEQSREMAALKLAATPLEEPKAGEAVQDLERALQSVRNPHVIPARQHGLVGTWGYQLFAPMAAEVLAQANESGEKFSPGECLRIANDIATGLQALHETNVCHGDLSPDNVVLARQNRARLLGVGLFAALNPPREDDTEVRPRPYFAPERLAEGPSQASDLYSLGLILYELLSGRQALSTVAGYQPGATDPRTTKPPAPLSRVAPHLPRPLEALTFSLLAVDPADRCSSAAVFRGQIRQLVAGARRKTTPPGT